MTPVISEVEVYVWRVDSRSVYEPLKYHTRIPSRINLCDLQEPADYRCGRAPSPRPDRDRYTVTIVLTPANDVRGCQEEVYEVLFLDMLHLILDSLSEPALLFPRSGANVTIAPPVAEPFPD